MALFYINFKAIIKQKHPSEEIHIIEFSRRLEDEHWWDPLPQIGSTILIPFIEDGGALPYSGTHAVDKTLCKVVDILHELNGQLSYEKTTVFCEFESDLLYIMETYHCMNLSGFISQLDARGWNIHGYNQ